jgi:hypothetical protein
MKLQRMLENAKWIDVRDDLIDSYIERVVSREQWLAPRENRQPMTAPQIIERLGAGVAFRTSDDWYAQIRDADAMKPRAVTAASMTRCDCGHLTQKALVMNTSRGTACPACYDRMSE